MSLDVQISAPLVDSAAFEQLLEDTGPEIVARLLEIYERELPARLEDLRGAPKAVRVAAHLLGSTSLQMGALRLGNLCRHIESHLTTLSPEDLDTLRDIGGETVEALKAIFASLTESS